MRSLKGNAFDWYTDLELKYINSWDQLEREFLLRLRHTLSILHIEEKSIDYYVPTEPMIIHDSIIESITYWFQTEGMLW